MRVRQQRGKSDSSSSGCQSISLTSSACGQRNQSRSFEDGGFSPRTGGPLRAESHGFLLPLCFGSSHLLLVFLHLLLFLSARLRAISRSRRLAPPHPAISSATTSLRNPWAFQVYISAGMGRPETGSV